MAPTQTLMESSRLTPGSERSLSSTLCRTHTNSPMGQMGLCDAHVNSLLTRLLVGKHKSRLKLCEAGTG